MPMNDLSGLMFLHLKRILPVLKTFFAQAIVSVSASTQIAQPNFVAWLKADDFFQVIQHDMDLPVGDDFWALYKYVATVCHADQIAHLCFIDRIAFALQSDFRERFIADIQGVTWAQTPLLFQRSTLAWQTHPRNYREIELLLTYVG